MRSDSSSLQEHDTSDTSYHLDGGSLGPFPRCLTERLVMWAQTRTDSVFLAQRAAGADIPGEELPPWVTLTFGEAATRMVHLAQALLDHDLSPDRPLVILSGNDLHHALLTCAALHVGIPCVPVSPAYALMKGDHARLRHALETVTPGMIFVDDEARFAAALDAVGHGETPLVATRPSARAHAFESMADTPLRGDSVERAHEAVTGDSVAKLLFTSGSTGMPGAVINTQRMLCSNQAMLAQQLPFLASTPPVLVDWLPWHHTFGGNTILGMALYHGGALYIDDGNPTPEGVRKSVANLREISPTFYCNVPKGFEALAGHLRDDTELRDIFFKRLEMMHFGGAVLPGHVRRALEALGRTATGRALPMLAGLGSTEACLAFSTVEDADIPGLIGRPVPGLQVRLVRSENKWEARLKGPSVTPGYWRDPERTREAFDEQGYYCTGDAMRPLEPGNPGAGLVFDGRLSENFKLSSGTWVNVGALRLAAVDALAPVVQDIVIVGEGRDYLTALVVLHPAGCRQQLGCEVDIDPAALAHDEALRAFMTRRLSDFCTGRSSSMCLERLLILDFPLSLDRGEVTDKGSVNQRLVREGYPALIDELYAAPPSSRLILPT
ncbi:feruloyl-CoA synthase [Kushneria phyllosphaerae]|uniref:Carboxylic acid reductase n=1 Tax=Kushneria phyllosphaerae TaxID=2100822 RepID=A0A2R8CH23_9GAMM|nr:feruloyl-CoA synthase [Kushneria phyllosphaerae]SPJ32169.1 Carboxylic acid reductase [Kushneria phyllosphaerae]